MPLCPTRAFAFYGSIVLAICMPVIVKTVIHMFGRSGFLFIIYCIAAFFFLKFVLFIFLASFYNISGYHSSIKKFFGFLGMSFVFMIAGSSLFYDFTNVALIILLIELTLFVYGVAIAMAGVTIFGKVKTWYYRILNAIWPNPPRPSCNPYDLCEECIRDGAVPLQRPLIEE